MSFTQILNAMSDYKYQKIIAFINNRINKGEWGPNSRLPAIRVLARENNVNNTTVIAAYKYLQQAGRVYTRKGSGTFVAPMEATEAPEIRDGYINFAGSTPDASFFPAEALSKYYTQALAQFGKEAFIRQDPLGYLPLREVLGAGADPRRVVLFSDGLPFLQKLVNGYGVQDGSYDDFYYDGKPRERSGDVYYKNFSKILMPGLSFMVVPKGMEARLDEVVHSIVQPDELLCKALNLFFRSTCYETYTGKMRYDFGKRYRKVLEGIRIYLSDFVTYEATYGGLGIQLHLNNGDKNELFTRLIQRGVVLSSDFKINFACVQENRIHEGIGIIATEIQRVRV